MGNRRWKWPLRIVVACLVLTGGGLLWHHQQGSRGICFRECAAEMGIDFTHFGANRVSLLPEDVGSGAAWGDYDNDGDDDLLIINFAGPYLMSESELQSRPGNRLYRNDRTTFTDVTQAQGLSTPGWNYAGLWFDYDNDGWLDLVVTHVDGVRLYHNAAGKHFDDVTSSSGLDAIRQFLLGATAADYDHDGDLDLYLCGYVQFSREAASNRPLVAGRPAVWTNPVSYAALPNHLLRNDGAGHWADVTTECGVENTNGKSMQAVFCDFNNDQWPDLYVANDVGTADVLYLNLTDGRFREVSIEAGTPDRRASMGLAVGDVEHRGWMDLFVTHWVAEDHALWKNRTDEFGPRIPIAFDDVAPQLGITKTKLSAYVGWGTGLLDFDNDGELDLFIVNGSTIEDELTLEVLSNPKLIPQPAQMLRNDGTGHFIDVSAEAGDFFSQKRVGRGLACSDYNLDGRLDALVVSHNDRASLLANCTKTRGNWLQVKLSGKQSNRFGIGATIAVVTPQRTLTHQVVLGASYLSGHSLVAHFGLGDVAAVERIDVLWPSGRRSQVARPNINRQILIDEGESLEKTN